MNSSTTKCIDSTVLLMEDSFQTISEDGDDDSNDDLNEEDEGDDVLTDVDEDSEEHGQRLPLLHDRSTTNVPHGARSSFNTENVVLASPHHVLPSSPSFPGVHHLQNVLPNGVPSATRHGGTNNLGNNNATPPSPIRLSTGYSQVNAGNVEEGLPKRPRTTSARLRYPREIKKTLVAFIFMLFNMLLTGVSLALVHESMPDYPPLPDQILDRVTYQQWALFGSEYLIQFQTVVACLILLFHKHRFIVFRRAFLIVGVLYLYRAITMFVTALPKADPQYLCEPKSNGTLTVGTVVLRSLKILTGFGLSINGHHVFCGDYIYSGHTTILIAGYLVVKEYTPRRFFFLHWLSLITAVTSVVLLLLSRGHYTVDVVIAYFVTTRTWAIYHTLAYHVSLKQGSGSLNQFRGFWWFEAFTWMEAKVKAGKIPNEYNLPVPSKLVKTCRNLMRTQWRKSRRQAKLVAGSIS